MPTSPQTSQYREAAVSTSIGPRAGKGMPPKPVDAAGHRFGLPERDRHQFAEAERGHGEVVALEAQARQRQQQAAETGDGAGQGEGEQERPAALDRRVRADVRADADEGGVPERDLAGVSEEQRQADDDEGVDAGEREHLQQVAVGDQEQERGHDDHGDDRHQGADGAAAHQTFTRPEPPSRPCGRTNRTTSSTTRATASRYVESM